MKTLQNIAIHIMFACCALGDGVQLPADDPLITASLDVPPVNEATIEELAAPPVGMIRKFYFRDVEAVLGALVVVVAEAPPGMEGKDSDWQLQFQTIKSGLEKLHASHMQRDLFEQIPRINSLLEAKNKGELPEYFHDVVSLFSGLGRAIVDSIAVSVANNGANLQLEEIKLFASVFASEGLRNESDWEDEVIPVDSAGVFILDSGNVFDYLKSQPWERAEQFMGGLDGREAFVRYEGGGNGLEVIKSKFSSSRANIIAKWDELGAWVAMQRGANE